MLSLFSGIGAFEKALKNLDIPFELVSYCEIDKYASKSYSVIHDVPETMNLGDITKIDEKALPKDIDLITYGFPCQDISLAGKQKGLFNEDGTQTRSGLFFEALRIIEETQPKIAIAENVKNLVGKKFNAQFQAVLASLEAAGYNNYWQVLNAKDYGIPQNRERVFIVSIRKDIDTGYFKFPEPIPLTLRLKDVLEDKVDEKFYLSKKAINGFNRHKERHIARGNGFGWQPSDGSGCAFTLQTSGGSRPNDNFIDIHGLLKIQNQVAPVSIKQIGQLYGTEKEPNPQAGRIYDAEGISPTLDTCSGGNRMPKVAVAMRGRYNEDGKVEQKIEIANREIANAITTVQKDSLIGEPKIDVIGNYSPSGHDASRIVSAEGLAPTVKENHGTVTAIVEPVAFDEQNGYIRKDGCVGTLTTDGSSPKHNNRIIEFKEETTIQKVCNIYPSGGQNGNVYDINGISPTILSGETNTKGNGGIGSSNSPKIAESNLRIRKLTPKECFRLMGFSDEDFAKAEAVNSNTQLYKQAGNSIVVDVIVHIFKRLKPSFKPEYRDGDPDYPICPNCRTPLNEMEDCDCGQKIDWSEE